MRNGNMLAAVSQDLMCAPFILGKSGLTVQAHQEVTIERYLRLTKLTDAYVWRTENIIGSNRQPGVE